MSYRKMWKDLRELKAERTTIERRMDSLRSTATCDSLRYPSCYTADIRQAAYNEAADSSLGCAFVAMPPHQRFDCLGLRGQWAGILHRGIRRHTAMKRANSVAPSIDFHGAHTILPLT